MKGNLARLGIRNFRPTLRNAAEHLAALSTPEGSPLPPNVAAELERDIARLRLVIGQIKQIEEARRQRLEEQPERGPHAMVRLRHSGATESPPAWIGLPDAPPRCAGLV